LSDCTKKQKIRPTDPIFWPCFRKQQIYF